MKTFFLKIKGFCLSHKIITIVSLIVIIVAGYFIFKGSSSTETKYITEQVKKGDITVYVTGSGQVEATNSLDITSKASGEITYIGVKAGDAVKKGDLIAVIDYRDAKIALENAQISLDKLKNPDSLTLMQKESSLKKSYNDAWNDTSLFIVDANDIVSDLGDLYNDYLGSNNSVKLSKAGKTKISESEDLYWKAKNSLDEITKVYKSMTRSSVDSEIENIVKESITVSKIISNAVKSAQTTINYVSDYLDDGSTTDATEAKDNAISWLTDSNNYVNTLISDIDSITEANQSLTDTETGDELDIRQAELSLALKQNAYENYFVRAPFDGIIASFDAKVGQSASGSMGTIITKDKIATIPLNEVDIANIKTGQKTTITFDAISGLSIEGEVVEVDSSGTVSSGVVTYNVKIAFNENDDRIKPGMSVNASIIANDKRDILVIPSSAVKTKNNQNYVEVLTEDSGIENIVNKNIQIGISDETQTELVSGLSEGESVITKTVSVSSSSKSSSTPSILNSMNSSNKSKTQGAGAGMMLR